MTILMLAELLLIILISLLYIHYIESFGKFVPMLKEN